MASLGLLSADLGVSPFFLPIASLSLSPVNVPFLTSIDFLLVPS